MLSDANLSPVYAIRVCVIQGVPHYHPRSQAFPTDCAPKLWVKKRDAERVARNLPCWLRRHANSVGVVEFRLAPDNEEANDER